MKPRRLYTPITWYRGRALPLSLPHPRSKKKKFATLQWGYGKPKPHSQSTSRVAEEH